MKALKLTVLGILFFISTAVLAQVTITIGSPPAWGPVGYAGVRYYYLPDVECYYDIHSSQFIYYQPSGWVYASRLPNRYRNYNLYNGYKVVMTDYRGNTPYDYFPGHKRDYKKGGYHGEKQKTNGNSHSNGKQSNKGKKNH